MKLENSKYVENEQREFALYTLTNRAIPYAADGLKSSTRRVLWTAQDGKKYKSASLAGACLPLHPHGSPEGAVNTLAAYYGNNIPLLKGDGAFGTLLDPTSYGASRYTSVTISKFTKEVVFKDIEIIPMMENYDGTLLEPKHFLPLMPIVVLNPQEGIATGFASNILSRNPETIIKHQIDYLEGKINFRNPPLTILPLDQISVGQEDDKNGNPRWVFHGSFEIVDTSTVKIINLPYGLDHSKYIDRLIKMIDDEKIQDYEDNSKDSYDIEIKFKRGQIKEIGEDNLLSYLGLVNNVSENFTVIDFDGKRVWETNYVEFVQKFTEWRLQWYVKRFERLKSISIDDIQKYRDIILAIKKNLGGVAKGVKNKDSLREFCKEIGIVNIEYIVELPVYRFTEEEKEKIEQKIIEVENQVKNYNEILKSDKKRREIYINELVEVKELVRKILKEKN